MYIYFCHANSVTIVSSRNVAYVIAINMHPRLSAMLIVLFHHLELVYYTDSHIGTVF